MRSGSFFAAESSKCNFCSQSLLHLGPEALRLVGHPLKDVRKPAGLVTILSQQTIFLKKSYNRYGITFPFNGNPVPGKVSWGKLVSGKYVHIWYKAILGVGYTDAFLMCGFQTPVCPDK